MKMPFLSLTRLFLGTVAGIGIVLCLLPQSSRADEIPGRVNPIQDFNDQNNDDPFARGADDFSILNLIQRAAQSNGRSLEEYTSEQNESLNTEASEFRARQREMIQGQQQTKPGSSVTVPQAK